MRFKIELTFSKFMALLILGSAVVLDIRGETLQAFIYALPFVVALIGGKQAVDYLKIKK